MSRVTLAPTFIPAPRIEVNRNLSKWHSEYAKKIESILVRGTVNFILAYLCWLTQVELKELNPPGESLGALCNIDRHYTWSFVKKELQDCIYPVNKSFSTWSSVEKIAD